MKTTINEAFDFNSNIDTTSKDFTDDVYQDLKIQELVYPDFGELFKKLNLTSVLLELCNWYYRIYFAHALYLLSDSDNVSAVDVSNLSYYQAMLTSVLELAFNNIGIFKLKIFPKALYNKMCKDIAPLLQKNGPLILESPEIFKYFDYSLTDLHNEFLAYVNKIKSVNEAFDFNNIENSKNIGNEVYDDLAAYEIMHPDLTEIVNKLQLNNIQAELCNWYYLIYMSNAFKYAAKTIQDTMNNDYLIALLDTTTENEFTKAGVFKCKIFKKALFNQMVHIIRPLIKENVDKISSIINNTELIQYFKLSKDELLKKFHTYVYDVYRQSIVKESFDFNNVENTNNVGRQTADQIDLIYPKFEKWLNPTYSISQDFLQLCYECMVAFIISSLTDNDDNIPDYKDELSKYPNCSEDVKTVLDTLIHNAIQTFIWMYVEHFLTIAKRLSLQYKFKDLLFKNIPKIFTIDLENHWIGKYHTLKEEYLKECRKHKRTVYESFDFNNVDNSSNDMYDSIFGNATPEDLAKADEILGPFDDENLSKLYRATLVVTISAYKENSMAGDYLLDAISGNYSAILEEHLRKYFERYLPKHPWYTKWWGETFIDILVPMQDYITLLLRKKQITENYVASWILATCKKNLGAFLRLGYYEKCMKERK